jgi:predicted Zn-dependent protease
MTDREIRQYFVREDPLDKAGGFDVLGPGAGFIRRIEGCFYTIVGLPLGTLRQMLKKFGVILSLFAVCATLFTSGCATEYNLATGREEWIYYTTEQEVNMGRSVAAKVANEFNMTDDDSMRQRVRAIGEKIAAVCDRQDLAYRFDVIEEKEVNAFSVPGGFIYVNSGLMERVDDDELAGVLAHEVGHVVARHGVKRLQGMIAYNVLRVLVASAGGAEAVQGADAAVVTLLSGYSRDDEFAADSLAVKYARLAGYDPKATIRFLESLQEIMKKKPSQPYVYWRTHPFTPDRIRMIKQYLGLGMDFKDYMNIEDQPRN